MRQLSLWHRNGVIRNLRAMVVSASWSPSTCVFVAMLVAGLHALRLLGAFPYRIRRRDPNKEIAIGISDKSVIKIESCKYLVFYSNIVAVAHVALICFNLYFQINRIVLLSLKANITTMLNFLCVLLEALVIRYASITKSYQLAALIESNKELKLCNVNTSSVVIFILICSVYIVGRWIDR